MEKDHKLHHESRHEQHDSAVSHHETEEMVDVSHDHEPAHDHHHTEKQENHSQHVDHSYTAHGVHMEKQMLRRFVISIALTVPVLLLSPMFWMAIGVPQPVGFAGYEFPVWVLASIIFLVGGWPFLTGLVDELKGKKPGMMTLIGFSITVAYVYSTLVALGMGGSDFFWELVTLIDVMLLGHYIEMKSIQGASNAIQALARLVPQKAHKIDGQVISDVPTETLIPGVQVLVKAFERMPADGIVVAGRSEVDESMMTGESKPVPKAISSSVIGGSSNFDGSLTVKVTKTGGNTFLSQVAALVKETLESKSKTQNLSDKAAVWLTIIAISAGAITLVSWMLVQMQLGFALERAVTVMVIACPHALGLAVPLVVAVSAAIASRKGVLIKNRSAFEELRNVQMVIFDKTGTLTTGEFGVSDIILLDPSANKARLVSIAKSLESKSEHKIAKAIAKLDGEYLNVDEFKAMPGMGVRGVIEGKEVQAVSPLYLEGNGIKVDSKGVLRAQAEGETLIYLIANGQAQVAFALSDTVRPEAKAAIQELERTGVRCALLTGDGEGPAKAVAKELGIAEYFANVKPNEKSSKIEEIQKRGLKVAMVGDGVNDAPALAKADVGLAIGAGTDVALETADIILVGSDLGAVVASVKLSKATYGKMVQNLLWATGYNIVAIPLAAGVLWFAGIVLSPAVGAVLMSLSTIIVAINARLLRV